MKYSLTTQTQTIRENTTLMPGGFSGWYAKNIGSANVDVDGFVLEPGDSIDFHNLQPSVNWDSPIIIVCQAGGVLRITRFQYKK